MPGLPRWSAEPTASLQDLGHPCCGAHRTWGIVPLPEIPESPLLATSDICLLGLTVHFNLICWCFKYLVLFVLCCVNVNVRRLQTQPGASQCSHPHAKACDIWHLDSGTHITVPWQYRNTFYLFLELFNKWFVQCPHSLALVLRCAFTWVCKSKSMWAASSLNWEIMRLLGWQDGPLTYPKSWVEAANFSCIC